MPGFAKPADFNIYFERYGLKNYICSLVAVGSDFFYLLLQKMPGWRNW
jgi:hypothetical protein